MKNFLFYKIALVVAIFFGHTCTTLAQAPVNDDPCSAITLSVDTSCNLTEYTNENATDFGGDTPNCGFYQGSEVWFELAVPASGKLIVDLAPGTNSEPTLAVYQGPCTSLTLYDCNVNSSSNGGNTGRVTYNDISLAGQTLYFCVFKRNSAIGGTFEICAFEPVIPDYDFCSNAIPITVGSSCSFTEYTNTYCTGDSNDPSPSCGFYQGVDVWFTLTIPASGKLIVDLNPGTLSSPSIGMYQGTCGSLTQLFCNVNSSSNGGNVGRITINDIGLANEVVYIRVWPRASEDGGTFGICAWEPVIPDNDFCENAVALTVGSSCSFQQYTTLHCTGDPNDSNPSCGFYQGVDVWFTLTVPASGKLIVDLDQGTLTSPNLSLYQGSCGSLTQYDCNTNSSENGSFVGRITLNDISLANEFVYIRVWPRASVDGGTFSICAWEPFIPDNDFCSNAISIPVSSECTFVEYTNLHCTSNSTLPNPSCGFYNGVDVWFTATMPISGHLVIDLFPGINDNPALSVYTGDCNTLTQIACDQNRSENGSNVGKVTIHDESLGGQLLYIRVWPRASVNGGTFSICAWEPDIPDNDFCSNALELTVQGVECNLQTYSNANCTDSQVADSGPNPNCGFYSGVDVWFTATVPSDGQLIIDMGILDVNPNLAVYTGVCGSLVLYDCDTNSSENGANVGMIIIADLTLADEVIYIRVWHRGSTIGGEFQMCAYNPNFCGFFDVEVGEQGTCNPLLENYTQDVSFSYLNAPATGDVIVNGQSFPITSSPMTITLIDLPSNNQSVDLLIEFADELDCYYLDDNAWFAPICCEGDANFDGQVNVLDLIAVSSDFGCTGDCAADVNVDGSVNILDLISVSSNFGNNCL